MKDGKPDRKIEIFTTCPGNTSDSSSIRPGFYVEGQEEYLGRVLDTAKWSEQCGFKGMLIYIDNSLVDNWMIAQIVLQNTQTLIPLIAVQPIYMHPYWIAKKIATLGHLYNRNIALNMLAGAFRNDLIALGDPTPHDERYERMTEYTQVIFKLLSNSSTINFEGKYYNINKVKLTPKLKEELLPIIIMSGASDAGMTAARKLNAVAVRYPKPVNHYEENPLEEGIDFGIRMGIIARSDKKEAWEIAHSRFPGDRHGQLTHNLAMKTSDSVWHKQLSDLKDDELSEAYPYWLFPFQNYKTFCPYLVGTYDQIAKIIARYSNVGFKTFITDIPGDKDELLHQKIVFEMAEQLLSRTSNTEA